MNLYDFIINIKLGNEERMNGGTKPLINDSITDDDPQTLKIERTLKIKIKSKD